MNKTLCLAALSAFVACGWTSSAQAAASADANDLILGFYGSTSEANVQVNLGDMLVSAYLQPGAGTTLITNIGADLAAVYGNSWNTRSDVSWGVAGTSALTGTRTLYLSNDSGVSYSALISSNSINVSNAIGTLWSAAGAAMNVATTNGNVSGSVNGNTRVAVVSSADGTSWSTKLGVSTVDGSLTSIFGATNSRVPVNAFLSNTDFSVVTDPKVSQLTSAIGAGAWSNVGSFSLDSSGNVYFTATAVPEPSTYGLLGAGALAAAAVVRRRRKLSAVKAV